jgi:hypothetical protein
VALAVGLAVLFGGGSSAVARGAASEQLKLLERKLFTPADKPAGSPGATPRRDAPLLVLNEAFLRRAKRAAARRVAAGTNGLRNGGASARGSAPSPAAAVFGGLNEVGLTTADGSPPDTTGAIGPSHYIEMVNSEIGVFSRTNLAAVATVDLDDFVGAPGESVFDPQVQWDPQSNRWLYVAADVVAPGDSFLAVGWSRTASPTPLDGSGWCNFFVRNVATEFEDYPKLGHNDNHIILGTNVLDDSGGPGQGDFLTSRIWTIEKPANGVTTCPGAPPPAEFSGTAGSPLVTADGDTALTPIPANTAESAANGFVVAADTPRAGPNRTQIMAWHVSGPKGGPVVTADGNTTVPPFNFPANVPQPGTANVLDSLDGRLTQAVAVTDPAVGQQGVWTQHTVAGADGRSVVRWYELLPGSTTVRQQGSITDPSHFVFNGAISPTSSGDRAAINYNVGGSTLFAQLHAQSRDAGTPLGEMGLPVTLGASSVADQDFTCDPGAGDPCRWGDYAGASPDPSDPTIVWGSNQLNGPLTSVTSDPAWVTRNFALIADNTAPDLRLKGRRRQQNPRRVRVKVSSDEAVSVKVKGTIRVPRVRRARGGSSATPAKATRFRLKPASTSLAPGRMKTTLKLKLRKKVRQRVNRTLRRGKRSRAILRATATDAAGISADVKLKISLKRKR